MASADDIGRKAIRITNDTIATVTVLHCDKAWVSSVKLIKNQMLTGGMKVYADADLICTINQSEEVKGLMKHIESGRDTEFSCYGIGVVFITLKFNNATGAKIIIKCVKKVNAIRLSGKRREFSIVTAVCKRHERSTADALSMLKERLAENSDARVNLPSNNIFPTRNTKFQDFDEEANNNSSNNNKPSEVTVGGMPLPFNNLSERELEALANFKPTLTYGQAKQGPPEDFVPAHVAWDKKDWLESQGIEINPMEDCPDDPYMVDRKNREPKKTMQTPSDFDKLRQFLEMDRRVLRFYCVWDDRDQMFGQMRKFIVHYYLSDDTMEIREVRIINDGHDPFPCLIYRHRIPRDRYDIEPSFPLGAMEITDEEVKEYFSPIDFKIGKTIVVYNRRFLIYDMDNFTKAFYWKNFGMTDFTPMDVVVKQPAPPVKEYPPYNTHGSVEDSMQNCRKVVPEPPRKDYIKMLDQQGKVLRYEAMLDSTKPGDKCRRFIISYRLCDDTINIYEPPIRNSGVIGGRFLEPTRVAKPDTRLDQPEYYGPQDLYIGAVFEVFKHRFIITNADYYVLKYLEKHCHQVPECTLQSLRDKLGGYDDTADRQLPIKGGPVRVRRSGNVEDLQKLVAEVKTQLKKLAITANNRKDKIFLGFDVGRAGCINRENLQDICLKHHLPCDNDIIDCLARQIGQDPDHITLEELRQFFEEIPK